MPPEATRGLFGSGPRADAKTTLDVRASIVEGYDSDVPRSLASTIDPSTLQSGGFSTLLDTSASYGWRKDKTELAANATSVLRHYAELGNTKSVGHSAGVGFTTETLGGTTLFANQSAAFTPAYLYGLFPGIGALEPGDAGLTAPDYGVSDLESYLYTTTMSLTHGLGRRSSVSATGEYFYTDRLGETDTWSDISSYGLRGRFSRNTTRNTAMSTELRYRSGEYGYRSGGTTTEFGLDIGFDYSRPISASRRATLSVRIGVSGADYPGSALGLIGFQRQYRTVGEATFNYPLNQTWTATANIRRGLEYASDLPTPVVANGVSASVTGLLTRRVDLSFLAAYASGESILNRDSLFFDTYTGDMRVRVAVSRTLAVFGEYLYYYYDFQNAGLLLGHIPPGLERNGVRAGLTLWMPALRR